MTTVDDIRKRLKQESYDERAVADGGRSLTTQLRGLIRTVESDAQPDVGDRKVQSAPPDRREPAMRRSPDRVNLR
jgi:hypothetical protein